MASVPLFLFIVLALELSFVYCRPDKYQDINEMEPMHFFPVPHQEHDGFVCPAIYGRYPHPDDCSVYYECRFSRPVIVKCLHGQLYDEHKEQCRDQRKVNCKNGGQRHTKEPENELSKEDEVASFKCPYNWGSFAHPVDCSKYFVCVYNVPAIFECRGSDLFDERARRCINKHRVRCGNRLDRDQMRTSRKPATTAKPTDKPTTASINPSWKPITVTTTRTRMPITATTSRTRATSSRTRGTTPNLRTTTVVVRQKFNCPFPYGRFPDPYECSQYYMCRSSIAELFKCPEKTLYDERRGQCREANHVRCGNRPIGGGDLTPPTRRTTGVTSRTKTSLISTTGRVTTDFPTTHTITAFPTTYSTGTASPITTDTRLPTTDSTGTDSPITRDTRRPTTDSIGTDSPITIDTRSPTTDSIDTFPTTTKISMCSTSPETRTARPTTLSTTDVPPTTFSETTPPTTATPSSTTTTPTTTSPTTVPPPTTTPTTASPTTVTPTTPSQTASTAETTMVTKPNTPPPTDCDEDDLDCIMDKTGDVTGWFDCPQKYGHFPHGSSRQLFIHCDNFRPFVKTCADGTVFSPVHLVCMWD